MPTADERLAAALNRLGITLPPAPEPKGLYRPVLVVGKLLYTAGHLPIQADGQLVAGRLAPPVSPKGDVTAGQGHALGMESLPPDAAPRLDLAAGQAAARWAALGILASLKRELGALDRVRRVVKVVGLVNSESDFTQQPAVLNAGSELLAEVFGPESGVGVRSALGTNVLPLGAAVEIEAIFELH